MRWSIIIMTAPSQLCELASSTRQTQILPFVGWTKVSWRDATTLATTDTTQWTATRSTCQCHKLASAANSTWKCIDRSSTLRIEWKKTSSACSCRFKNVSRKKKVQASLQNWCLRTSRSKQKRVIRKPTKYLQKLGRCNADKKLEILLKRRTS